MFGNFSRDRWEDPFPRLVILIPIVKIFPFRVCPSPLGSLLPAVGPSLCQHMMCCGQSYI